MVKFSEILFFLVWRMPQIVWISSWFVLLTFHAFDMSTCNLTYSTGFSPHSWNSYSEIKSRGRVSSKRMVWTCCAHYRRILALPRAVATKRKAMLSVLVPTNCDLRARRTFK